MNNSLNEFKKATPEEQLKMIKQVEDNLNLNNKWENFWLWLDKNKVIAWREFLKQVKPKTFLQKTKDKAEDIVDKIAEKVWARTNFRQNVDISSPRALPNKMTPKDIENLRNYLDNAQKKIENKMIAKTITEQNKTITDTYIDSVKRAKIKSIWEKLDAFAKSLLPSTFKNDIYNVVEKIAKFTWTKSNIIENTKSPILKPKIIETLRKG